jgi:DNA polymerase III subunit alpha
MKNSDFVHLHAHTEMSSFDGLSKIDEMTLLAKQMGFKALAITDHGTVGGWVKFNESCKNKKYKTKQGEVVIENTLKPILGCEFYVARDHLSRGSESNPDGRKGNRHLVLLAKNHEGYKNICKMSQASYVDGFYSSPRIDLNLLAKHSEGVIASSACLSSVVNNNLLKGRYDAAKKVSTILKDIFKDDFYLEVMFHGMDEQAYIIPDVLKLGNELGIKVIVSNDVHYLQKPHASTQELLMAISTSKCIKDPKRMHHGYDEFYLKSAEEMLKPFTAYPNLLTNTLEIADKISNDVLKTEKMILPNFDIKKAREENVIVINTDQHNILLPDNRPRDINIVKAKSKKFEESYSLLVDLCLAGMKKLNILDSQKHVDRLNLELTDVRIAWTNNTMDFATYFIVVWDIINFCNKSNILIGPGRGSGYASIILRVLGITYGPVDILEYGLIWERFLGFSEIYSLSNKDIGYFPEEDNTIVNPVVEINELFDDRELEDDLGGIDRV